MAGHNVRLSTMSRGYCMYSVPPSPILHDVTQDLCKLFPIAWNFYLKWHFRKYRWLAERTRELCTVVSEFLFVCKLIYLHNQGIYSFGQTEFCNLTIYVCVCVCANRTHTHTTPTHMHIAHTHISRSMSCDLFIANCRNDSLGVGTCSMLLRLNFHFSLPNNLHGFIWFLFLLFLRMWLIVPVVDMLELDELLFFAIVVSCRR